MVAADRAVVLKGLDGRRMEGGEILWLARLARAYLVREANVVDLEDNDAGTTVAGDLHGDVWSTWEVLEKAR